jgi:hypothetical protein
VDPNQIQTNIVNRGRDFFAALGNETPSIFKKNHWTGKVMDWSMSHEDFKVQLFRFIDVLPCLTTEEMLNEHIQEYFARDENVPAVLRFGAKSAGIGGRLGMKVVGKTIRKNLENMAYQFIIGSTIPETIRNLSKLRHKNFAFTSVFSRSLEHLQRCRKEFRVGNLYFNRGCTGAIVERQPFGGFKMSGIGSKAGGPDYLLQFMEPRTVTENTMRRGFVPVRSKDRWIE